MIPRKKRRLILIVSIILIVLIILTAFILIYINTDMFKSNKTLFMKYLEKNIENMDEMYAQINQMSDYENSLEQNKYTVNTQINVNNTENLGTTEENTDNVINQLKIVADGQVDKVNQYNYQKMNLYKGEESILGLEYIENSNTYGLRFSDLFQQFLLADNSNLQDLFSKLGYSNEEISNMPNQIDLNTLLSTIMNISDEEKQTLSNKYIEIIKNNLEDKNFSKEENQTIEIDGKSVQVNAYSAILTKEQLNNLYISILEQLKNDETILNKINTIQTAIDQISQIFQNTSIDNSQTMKDLFITEIDSRITQINQSNIGQDETKIIVYENMKNTVRTTIQTAEYEINLDYLKTNGETFIQIKESDMTNDTTNEISLTKNSSIEININNVKGEEESNTTIIQNKEVNGNTMKNNITARYEDSDNRVEAYITQNYQTVNQFNNEIILDNENSIKLNDLEQEQLQSLMSTVTEGINGKISEIQNQINMQEIQQVLVNAQILKEEQNIQATGTTEVEKTRYNSQFEMLKGENLESSRILSAIDASQNYISNLEVISNTELRIVLNRNGNNPEIVTTLQNFIEEHKNEHYNIDVEYDEETGLISSLLLIINNED